MSRKGENIYKRKDGRWEARYIKEHRINGRIHYGYCYGKTYHEARDSVCMKLCICSYVIIWASSVISNIRIFRPFRCLYILTNSLIFCSFSLTIGCIIVYTLHMVFCPPCYGYGQETFTGFTIPPFFDRIRTTDFLHF